MKRTALLLVSLLVAAMPMMAADAWTAPSKPQIDAIYPQMEALYEKLHRNPELSHHEVKTAATIAAQLRALGFDVTTGVGGTGVVGVLKNGPGPTVMIRAELDAGRLVQLGLVRTVDRDPRMLGRNHQVVAYGYELDGDALTLQIYDPNVPDRDDVTLSLEVSDPMATVKPVYSAPVPAAVCFLLAPYRPADPAAWRSP